MSAGSGVLVVQSWERSVRKGVLVVDCWSAGNGVPALIHYQHSTTSNYVQLSYAKLSQAKLSLVKLVKVS